MVILKSLISRIKFTKKVKDGNSPPSKSLISRLKFTRKSASDTKKEKKSLIFRLKFAKKPDSNSAQKSEPINNNINFDNKKNDVEKTAGKVKKAIKLFNLRRLKGKKKKKVANINIVAKSGTQNLSSVRRTESKTNKIKSILKTPIHENVVNLIEKNDMKKQQRYLARINLNQKHKIDDMKDKKGAWNNLRLFRKHNAKLDKQISEKLSYQKRITELDSELMKKKNRIFQKTRDHNYDQALTSTSQNTIFARTADKFVKKLSANTANQIQKISTNLNKNKKIQYALKPISVLTNPLINVRKLRLFKKYRNEFLITLVVFGAVVIFLIAFFSYLF